MIRTTTFVGRLIWYWAPLGLYAGLIIFLSSMSTPLVQLPTWYEGLDDKILHALEYAILAILFYRAYLHAAGATWSPQAPLLALVSAVVFGLTDEIHQYFVPLRYADGWDFFADAVGASLGIRLWRGLRLV